MDTLNWDEMRRPGSPWAYLVVAESGAVDAFLRSEVAEVEPELVLRTLRGIRCADKEGLFGEFAAAMEFPPYFGKNWQALDECLNDLDWLPGSGYVLTITDAEALLPDDEVALRTLLETMRSAATGWAKADEANPFQDTRPLPFRVVFQCATRHADVVRKRIAPGGLEFGERALPAVAPT